MRQAARVGTRDLSEWIVRLIEDESSGIYNAMGPAERLTIDEMVRTIHSATDSDATFTHVPADFLAAEEVPPFAYMPWTDPAGPNAAFMQVPNARALAAGITFRPLSDTARVMIEEYRERSPEDVAAGLGGRGGLPPERERDVLAAWKVRTA